MGTLKLNETKVQYILVGILEPQKYFCDMYK